MTVSDTANIIQYAGTGSTATFSTGLIVFYDDTDLIVTERVVSTGVETILTLGVGYTVTGGSGAAGSITLLAGNLPATKTLTIERSIPYSQSSDYKEGEAILAEELETSLDRLAIMAQQNNSASSRSLKLSSTLPTSIVPVVTQAPVDGQILAWSGASGNIVNAEIASSNTIDAVFSGLANNDFFLYNNSNWYNASVSDVRSVLGLKLNNYTATTAPTVNDDSDDGYEVGSQWYDQTGDNMYHCLDATVGAAVWQQGDVVVGDLGGMAALDKTNQSDAEAGIRDDVGMTPLSTKQAIDAQTTSAVTGTATATTSGTQVDYTGIPSTVKRITVTIVGLELSGTDELLIQLGDAGGFETTGYTADSTVIFSAGNPSSAASSSGFLVNLGSGNIVSGSMIITLHDDTTDTWVSSSVFARGDTTANVVGGGSKALSDTLTQIRITPSGANTFSAGSVNVTYE